MAATSVGEIGLDLVLNSKEFNKQMSGISRMAKRAGAALAGAFAVKQIVDFGASCIELGSDLQEVQNVVDVSFPKMSGQVDAFAQNAASSFGLSETMAKQFTGQFGAMAKAFGFSEKEAYNMSTALTGLAGDVASFYNITQDEAYTKLTSVFTGETESLKELGVVMTENALNSYAMANGFGRTTQQMSEAEKVALRYQFVMSQLSLAQGDFARTSDSWANQTRILKLQFDSIKATLGQGFINLFTPIIKAINTLLGKLATLANAFKSFTELITGKKSTSSATTGMTNLSAAADNASSSVSSVGDSASSAGKKAKKAAKDMRSLMGFDQINKLNKESKDTSNSSKDGTSGGTVSVAPVNYGSVPKSDGSTLKLGKEYDALKKSVQGLKDAFSGFANVIKSGFVWVWENILKPFGKWTITKLAPKLIDVLAAAFRVLTAVCEALAPIFKTLWEVFFKPIANFVGDAILFFLGLLADALNGLANLINNHQSLFQGIVTTLLGLLAVQKVTGVINNFRVAFLNLGGIAGVMAKLKTSVSGVFSVMKMAFSPTGLIVMGIMAAVTAGILLYKNWDKVKATAQKVWTAITDAIAAAVAKIKAVFGAIVGWFQEKYNAIKAVFAGVGNWFGDKFKAAYTAVKNAFSSIGSWFSGKWTAIKNVFKSVGSWFGEKFRAAWNAIKKPFNAVGSFFGGIWKTIKSKFSTIGSKIGDSIGGAFKTAINAVLRTVENGINWVPKSINKALGLINKLPGVNIPSMPTISLPRLAQGGYVKPNTPQLAMIGDNRHQGEVVAPEDKLRQMAIEAVKAASGTGGITRAELESILNNAVLRIVAALEGLGFYVDSEELARAVKNGERKRNRRYSVIGTA